MVGFYDMRLAAHQRYKVVLADDHNTKDGMGIRGRDKHYLAAPADSPNIVTRFGSPPNACILR